jgi:hypothetical protein
MTLHNLPRLSMIRNRKCITKNCNNICLFGIDNNHDINYCFKHYSKSDEIGNLEKGFFVFNFEKIIPTKKIVYSFSYLSKMICNIKKIIALRSRLIYKNRRNHQFNYMFLDIIFAYKLYLDILLECKRNINKYSLSNHGLELPTISIVADNYLKFDSYYYRNNVTPDPNSDLNMFHFNMMSTFDSLSLFHPDLDIIPYQKDILLIKKDLEVYHYKEFQKNFKEELSNISVDSINIIKDFYFTNSTYDDTFNTTFLNRKKLNNDFLKNVIILCDRKWKKIHFFNKNKMHI